jgi:hypothetical protein
MIFYPTVEPVFFTLNGSPIKNQMVRIRRISVAIFCIFVLGLSSSSSMAAGTADPVKKKVVASRKIANTKTAVKKAPAKKLPAKKKAYTSKPVAIAASAFAMKMMAVYDSLHLDQLGLNAKVFRLAMNGLDKLRKQGRLGNENIVSIVDFSQPSVNKRLYVLDLANFQVLFNTFVAHGMRSGKDKALSFSNKMSSHKSSLGFYVTDATYTGSNGYSLRLQGVEKGFNDNAGKRAIVLHGADYVNEDWIASQGYIGRSYGCPAVAPELNQPIIDSIKEGTCLFIYHPTRVYLAGSKLIR